MTSDEIEQRRTSGQLKCFVSKVRAFVDSNVEELQRGRRKEGLYRAFVDEIIPLSQFAHLLYEKEARFLPVLGNQGFDVQVFDSAGRKIDRIEITKPHNGHAEALDNKILEEQGIGRIRVYEYGAQLDAVESWIAKTARSKSAKDYSDCTLVIVAAIDPPYEGELPEVERRSKELVARLEETNFNAKRAFFAVPALDKCFEIKS